MASESFGPSPAEMGIKDEVKDDKEGVGDRTEEGKKEQGPDMSYKDTRVVGNVAISVEWDANSSGYTTGGKIDKGAYSLNIDWSEQARDSSVERLRPYGGTHAVTRDPEVARKIFDLAVRVAEQTPNAGDVYSKVANSRELKQAIMDDYHARGGQIGKGHKFK